MDQAPKAGRDPGTRMSNSPHGARKGLCFQRPRGVEQSAQKATALVIGSDGPRLRSFPSFPGGSDGKESARSARDLGSVPGSIPEEYALEKGMATHSSILARRIL